MNQGGSIMQIKKLILLLREKNIELKDFELEYIVPTISYKNKKEIVEEFTFKMKRKQEEN